MPIAAKSRFAVKKFMTTLWFTVTSCRPNANGWGLRAKSRSTSSGLAVTRQKLAYVGAVALSSTTMSLDLCRLGILLGLRTGMHFVVLLDFAHVSLRFRACDASAAN